MPTEVLVPDIGDFSDVPIIEVHVAPGDKVNAEDPLLTLESDKATLDVPAPSAGTVGEVLVKVGDQVSEGTPILHAELGRRGVHDSPVAGGAAGARARPGGREAGGRGGGCTAGGTARGGGAADGNQAPAGAHAGPSVRRMARELGVDLSQISASGPKGRITKDDLLCSSRGRPSPPAPRRRPPRRGRASRRSRRRTSPSSARCSARTCRGSRRCRARSCTGRGSTSRTSRTTTRPTSPSSTPTASSSTPRPRASKNPYRVTLLAFLVKAVVGALKKHPEFNSSLSPEKDAIIVKEYYNIGIAVDTPGGLVVPVVKDADRKGIVDLSREFMEISAKARDGKLKPADMQGGTFTISSLGGIGGTSFTPIVNAPEVAILGVVRSAMKPVWNGSEFVPRNMLPLSVSYDHRVIDGALAARFTRHLCYLLEDDRRLLL